jgi:type II secretory ATPase GspE/PulE/Tfp pilus assembly ATPase PilB-like protein
MKNKDELFLYRAKEWGCEKCGNTGYIGRVGLFEILEITDKLETLILNNASRLQLEIEAIGEWMIPIRDDWLLKVILWEISLEELLLVLGS